MKHKGEGMTRDEFVDMLMAEHEKKQAIATINEQRRSEELALADEYKVDECNKKRNALAIKYADQVKAIQNS